jgi:hypothetical protein
MPRKVVNAMLFAYPRLYETRLVAYESHLPKQGLEELLIQLALVGGIAGDVIECGSAHCGTSVVMGRYIVAHDLKRRVFACDSFEGFDRIELAREHAAGLTEVTASAFTSISYGYVRRKIKALRLQDTVVPIKGYFQETLPHLPGPFALALIDCDLRDSLVFAAQTIWPKVPSGGRILFDDYTNEDSKGAREGVDLFVDRYRGEIADHGLLGRLYHIVRR